MKHKYLYLLIFLWFAVMMVLLTSCTSPRQAQQPPSQAEYVHMQIVLLNRSSYDFFKQGYKLGNKYWYISGNKTYPLPDNWSVWEARNIVKP